MTSSAGQAQVAAQYEKWIYPKPIDDLAVATAQGMSDGVAPKNRHWQFWPNGQYLDGFKEEINILVAGCGANAAARYAYQHPKARVTGIDLSAASLAHEQYLKEKHQLDNLTLHQIPIEDVARLGEEFHFIDSVGVLHHLPDPAIGLRQLKDVLHRDGVMGLMLYGLYGRMGVYLLQDLFRRLELTQTDEDISLVRETLALLHPETPGYTQMMKSFDLGYDAGLVDLFLHPIDRGYTVEGCLDYVRECGLVFQGWVNNFEYHPDGQIPMNTALAGKLRTLEPEALWKAMELLNGRMTQHAFYVCRKDRPVENYRLDFEGAEFLEYTPIKFIHRSTPHEPLNGRPATLQRDPYPAIPLNDRQVLLYNQADGNRTIRDCIETCGIDDTRQSIELSARNFFRGLWNLGYLFFRIPASK